MKLLQERIKQHIVTIEGLEGVLLSQLDPAVTMLEDCYTIQEGKLLLCGNGGSANDASHMATELTVRFEQDRKALAAIPLTDAGALTAAGNDLTFRKVFSRQVEALGEIGDVLVAFSTSGRSANVLEAIAKAKHMGLRTLGISGAHGLGCDVDIAVPSINTARIQEATLLVIHLIIESLEQRLPK